MAEFHNSGYRGLYNGETADNMFKRKHLQYREDILDNRRRWISCESILDNVQTEKIANDVHYEVWEKVRKSNCWYWRNDEKKCLNLKKVWKHSKKNKNN
mgnify:FL=1